MITLIGNLKGGTGKSTVTFNLAVWLESQGRSVTVFDLDPQSSLGDVNSIRNQESYSPQLKVKFKAGELQAGRTEEVLVDVGASDMDAFRFALCQADRVIIPISPSQADIWSTQRFITIVKECCEKESPYLYGFINRADTHHAMTESDEAAMAVKQMSDIEFIDCRWHQRAAYRRSFSEGLAVFEMEPKGKAAQEVNRLANILFKPVTKQIDRRQVRRVEVSA